MNSSCLSDILCTQNTESQALTSPVKSPCSFSACEYTSLQSSHSHNSFCVYTNLVPRPSPSFLSLVVWVNHTASDESPALTLLVLSISSYNQLLCFSVNKLPCTQVYNSDFLYSRLKFSPHQYQDSNTSSQVSLHQCLASISQEGRVILERALITESEGSFEASQLSINTSAALIHIQRNCCSCRKLQQLS